MNAIKLIALMVIVLFLAAANRWDLLGKLFFALCALFVVAMLWSRLSLRGLKVTREIYGDRAQVGESLSERIHIQNLSRLPKLWVEVVDQSTLPGHRAGRVVQLGPHGKTSWDVSTECTRRGLYHIGPFRLESGDPFGLFPLRKTLPAIHQITVYPPVVSLSGLDLPAGDLPGGSAAPNRTPVVTPNAAGVREYVLGDSFNRIAWNATARTGRLMVKEFELDPTADVWIALDFDRRHHVGRDDGSDTGDASGAPDSTEEYTVTIGASLAHHLLRSNRNVGLLVNGSQPILLPADRGDRQLTKILELLAVAQADSDRPLAETLLAETGILPRNSVVVIVTPSTDEEWAQAAAGLLARHIRVVAIVVEGSTFGGGQSALLVVSQLVPMGVPTYLIKRGDDIAVALSLHGQPGISLDADG
ncbi:DUF58 domain-containing protein [Nitrolancea hollandica]|uniref:DUF58 domain-containing protein n=1 Tax=Nitrolancea hollandica Lb TaxID=1129897 RepID=I4ENA5_9BACT|nr:DUF58 domain-containing protein [Nitrolancea hollandica]CCF86168.1 conserved exported hypothetical protein [Nitrolancea hollandica Lb]